MNSQNWIKKLCKYQKSVFLVKTPEVYFLFLCKSDAYLFFLLLNSLLLKLPLKIIKWTCLRPEATSYYKHHSRIEVVSFSKDFLINFFYCFCPDMRRGCNENAKLENELRIPVGFFTFTNAQVLKCVNPSLLHVSSYGLNSRTYILKNHYLQKCVNAIFT